MKTYKKTARKDPEGRVVHTCDGVDYVRRKCADGTFKYRKASESAASSKAKTRSKARTGSSVSKRRAAKGRYSGGGYEKLTRQTLVPANGYFQWDNPPGFEPNNGLIENLVLRVGEALRLPATNSRYVSVIKRSTRYKMFYKFIQSKRAQTVIRETSTADSQTANIQFAGIQFVLHDPGPGKSTRKQGKLIPPPTEMRLLLWYGNYGSDDYYHFARPKNRNVRKLYEWVGHHGGDRTGEDFGIIGIKRNHLEGVRMTAEQYRELSGGPGDNYDDDTFEDDDGNDGDGNDGDSDSDNGDDDNGGPPGNRSGKNKKTLSASAMPFPPTRLSASAKPFIMGAVQAPASTGPGSLQGSLPPNLNDNSRSRSRSRSGTGSKKVSKPATDPLQGSLPSSLKSSRSGSFRGMTKLEAKSKRDRNTDYNPPGRSPTASSSSITDETTESFRKRREAARHAERVRQNPEAQRATNAAR
jgi:hypothetical protein